MDNSSLIRFDDTIERVEVVQGGTSAIFGPGQPGATANFILRTGSDKTTGSIGLTYGSEGSERVDAFISARLSTDGTEALAAFTAYPMVYVIRNIRPTSAGNNRHIEA